MAKTSVATITTEIKRGPIDYNITDTDLDNLILDSLNRGIKRIKGLLKDNGFIQDITASDSFKTIDSQAYVDITQAMIVGDVASFTAVAGDTIKVTIDGVAYTTAVLTGDVLVSEVVTAINLATVAIGDVASENGGGFLVIKSPTTGSGTTSSVVIADGAGTPASRLFTVAAERTHTGINDLDELLLLSERTNKNPINIIPYDELISLQPDPTSSESSTPDDAARFGDSRIYFRPTPSQSIYIYMEYYPLIVDVAAGGTMPFEDKFDPILKAMVNLDVALLLKDATLITFYNNQVDKLIREIIVVSAKNFNENNQAQSRRGGEPFFSPRKPTI